MSVKYQKIKNSPLTTTKPTNSHTYPETVSFFFFFLNELPLMSTKADQTSDKLINSTWTFINTVNKMTGPKSSTMTDHLSCRLHEQKYVDTLSY